MEANVLVYLERFEINLESSALVLLIFFLSLAISKMKNERMHSSVMFQLSIDFLQHRIVDQLQLQLQWREREDVVVVYGVDAANTFR